jgi:xanthine dehydrogenase YagR molybdenum-binding subunit
MDELAVALKMDPVALRLKNYAERDPESNKPWSSKGLRDCYALAGERFGWTRRNPAARATRDGRWLVGSGMATATYPARQNPAGATARIFPDGRVLVRAGTQEIGCGTYTVMTQIAADALGLPPDRVRFELGETTMPENPASVGSVTASSTGSAVNEAAAQLRRRLVQLAIADPRSPLNGAAEGDVRVENGRLSLASNGARGEDYAALVARQSPQPIEVTSSTRAGAEAQQYSMHSFGAVFAEVRVDEELGEIRVSRVVTAHDVGRVLNAKTAKSQIIGGVVWGIGQALLEETNVDPRTGRYVNADLAEYHLPVNADVGAIDVSFVEVRDAYVNPIGVKGAGEIGITGVGAAIANAVYHATGVRVRDLPITLDKVVVR